MYWSIFHIIPPPPGPQQPGGRALGAQVLRCIYSNHHLHQRDNLTPLLGSFTQKWESFWESFRALGQLWLNQNVLGELFSGHETALVDFIDKVESMIMFVYYSWMKGDGRKLFITAG